MRQSSLLNNSIPCFSGLTSMKQSKFIREEFFIADRKYSGNLMARSYVKNGKKEGLEENFWGNGQLATTGSYENGMKHGTWFLYSSAGELLHTWEYEKDRVVKRF